MIFGFLPQNLETEAVAVAFIMSWHENAGRADREMAALAGFRGELYRSLGTRRDVLFEVADAALCRPGRVLMLAELCLEQECRRGHGAVYDALNCGESASPGCAGRCRRSRCRGGMTAGSGWPRDVRTGCGRTRRPARSGCSATATRGGRGTRS